MMCLQRKEAQYKDVENLAEACYIYYVQVWQQFSKISFFCLWGGYVTKSLYVLLWVGTKPHFMKR